MAAADEVREAVARGGHKPAGNRYIAFSKNIDVSEGRMRNCVDVSCEDNYVDIDLPVEMHLRTNLALLSAPDTGCLNVGRSILNLAARFEAVVLQVEEGPQVVLPTDRRLLTLTPT